MEQAQIVEERLSRLFEQGAIGRITAELSFVFRKFPAADKDNFSTVDNHRLWSFYKSYPLVSISDILIKLLK